VTAAITTNEWTHIRGSSRTSFEGFVALAGAAGRLEEAVNTTDMPSRAVVWGGERMAAPVYGILCLIAAARRPGQRLGNWSIGLWMRVWWGTAFGLATVTWSQSQTETAAQIDVSNVLVDVATRVLAVRTAASCCGLDRCLTYLRILGQPHSYRWWRGNATRAALRNAQAEVGETERAPLRLLTLRRPDSGMEC
jgi:hypothetical protein